MTAAIELMQTFPPCHDCGFVARLRTVIVGDVSDEDRAVLTAEDDEYREHVRHTTVELLDSTPLDVLQRRFNVAPIRKQFGSWAVTTYGLECLTANYAIPRSRLREPYWSSHMAEKLWVLTEDFNLALRAARAVHRTLVSPSTRFAVLQRDSFRCRLCGISADDGAVLEIDHRFPVARGGGNRLSNLWTLCWDCNRGKSAQLIGPETTYRGGCA